MGGKGKEGKGREKEGNYEKGTAESTIRLRLELSLKATAITTALPGVILHRYKFSAENLRVQTRH